MVKINKTKDKKQNKCVLTNGDHPKQWLSSKNKRPFTHPQFVVITESKSVAPDKPLVHETNKASLSNVYHEQMHKSKVKKKGRRAIRKQIRNKNVKAAENLLVGTNSDEFKTTIDLGKGKFVKKKNKFGSRNNQDKKVILGAIDDRIIDLCEPANIKKKKKEAIAKTVKGNCQVSKMKSEFSGETIDLCHDVIDKNNKLNADKNILKKNDVGSGKNRVPKILWDPTELKKKELFKKKGVKADYNRVHKTDLDIIAKKKKFDSHKHIVKKDVTVGNIEIFESDSNIGDVIIDLSDEPRVKKNKKLRALEETFRKKDIKVHNKRVSKIESNLHGDTIINLFKETRAKNKKQLQKKLYTDTFGAGKEPVEKKTLQINSRNITDAFNQTSGKIEFECELKSLTRKKLKRLKPREVVDDGYSFKRLRNIESMGTNGNSFFLCSKIPVDESTTYNKRKLNRSQRNRPVADKFSIKLGKLTEALKENTLCHVRPPFVFKGSISDEENLQPMKPVSDVLTFKKLKTIESDVRRSNHLPSFEVKMPMINDDSEMVQGILDHIETVTANSDRCFEINEPVSIGDVLEKLPEIQKPSNVAVAKTSSTNSTNRDESTDCIVVSDDCITIDSYDDTTEIISEDESSVEEILNEAPEVDSSDEAPELSPIAQAPTETGQYTSHPIKNGTLLILDENSVIYFHGMMKLTVYHGSVEILGKRLTAQTENVYSPRGSAFLSITNTNVSSEIDLTAVKLDIPSFDLKNSSDITSILAELKPKSSIVLCHKLDEKKMNFLEYNLAQSLFPRGENLKFKFRNYLGTDWSVVRINPEWGDILKSIKDDSRVLLCGGKGVGKSTLLRYLVNKLLDRYEKVVVIDLDPGQPEFTVPGCISQVEVDKPLLGPNYTHLIKPQRCVFVPNIDVTADFDTYLLCVKELVHQCDPSLSVPTIINHMGLTKGIGINLVSSAICDLAPSLVVQIHGETASKNFKADLTREVVEKHASLIAEGDVVDVRYRLLHVNSFVNPGNAWALQPRQMREMCILTYLSQMLPEDCTFITQAGVKLYKTDLANIKIFFNGKACDPKAVNANIVGLCTLEKWINDRPFFNCHGWGIVRGISYEYNYLTLLTPLEESELDKIDYLVLGSVNLPPSIYFRNHHRVRGIVPYVYEGNLHNFAKNPKRSIVPKPRTD